MKLVIIIIYYKYKLYLFQLWMVLSDKIKFNKDVPNI